MNITKDVKSIVAVRVFTVVTIGCICGVMACSSGNMVQQGEPCSNYSDWRNSEYVLPYVEGEAYLVIQGNCEPKEFPWTHHGNLKYSYDFGMPIGTKVIAARSGTVVFVRDIFTDNDHGKNQGNAIVILHNDGTYALYAHITNKGSVVKVGNVVKQGDMIALSGNSGESPEPHLHFQVNSCGDFIKCESIPVSFRNADPNNVRLEKGKTYSASK